MVWGNVRTGREGFLEVGARLRRRWGIELRKETAVHANPGRRLPSIEKTEPKSQQTMQPSLIPRRGRGSRCRALSPPPPLRI